MKLYLLGALTFYLISCAVACMLEFADIVSIWTFGEVYFSIPLYILLSPYWLYKRLRIAIPDAKVLKKYGFKCVGKLNQFDRADTDTLIKIKKEIMNQKIKLYVDDIIWNRKENEE